jgi:hypothetical protein
MQKYSNNITNRNGQVIVGASVAVSRVDGGAVTLYSDNGVTTTTNPLTTDANGYFEFYAVGGRYNFTVSGRGIKQYTITDELLNDPADDGTALIDHKQSDNSVFTVQEGLRNAVWLHANSKESDPFEQIPVYPQTFKDQATRIIPGAGRLKSTTRGSSTAYATDTAPTVLDQLWTNANLGSDIGVNWIANHAIQTTVGPSANGMIAGLFSEISTYVPNNGEIAGLVGMARALADRNPSGAGSGGDVWGAWLIANNNGWKSHLIGAEINVTNQYDHWPEAADPVNNDPADFTFGIQLYPDWSTKTNTRAISIRPNATAGWSTGILVSGFTDQGLFIDSTQAYRDPGTNALPADPVGLIFGQSIVTKMAVRYNGNLAWKLRAEGDFLMWRGDASNWYMAMKDSDKNLYLMNALFRLDTNGRLNVGGSSSVGNATGAGVTIQGDLAHPLAMTRTATASVAPGMNVASLRWRSGTNPGTLKLVAVAGTSATEVTIVDNVGAGNS